MRGLFDLHLLEEQTQALWGRLDLPAYEPDGQKEGREFLRPQGQSCSAHKYGCWLESVPPGATHAAKLEVTATCLQSSSA